MYNLLTNDSAIELQNIPDCSIDSVVTDPPYLINLFEQSWDSKDNDLTPVFTQCNRILKEGGYIISFAYPSTYHIIANMLQKANFEIQDMLIWQHEMGWPKSQDIGKKVEAYRITGKGNMQAIKQAACIQKNIPYIKDVGSHKRRLEGKPKDRFGSLGTNSVKLDHDNEWSGWFTDIKPTMEPLILAQKKYKGSAWNNCLKNGVGALNITAVGQDGKLAGNIFKIPKPSKSERNLGLNGDTDHPSVKPVQLMRLLNKLITPSGGTIVDPFMGSGTTGIAAVIDGYNFIGIDSNDNYVNISKKRIEASLSQIKEL